GPATPGQRRRTTRLPAEAPCPRAVPSLLAQPAPRAYCALRAGARPGGPRRAGAHVPETGPPSQSSASSVPSEEAPAGAGSGSPERELLERVRARDPEALGQFYERYVDLVFGLAWRMLGERVLAEDEASDVFLKVHRAA